MFSYVFFLYSINKTSVTIQTQIEFAGSSIDWLKAFTFGLEKDSL